MGESVFHTWMHPFPHLLGLRYRLLWAQARLKSGRIILFIVGYLILFPVLAMLALGGLGTSVALIRSGHTELAVGTILCVCFLMSSLAAVVLGFGINSAFSDRALRRYPVSPFLRLVARHLSAFLDPFWILVLVLYLGIMGGLVLFGAASFWIAMLAAVLLSVNNYLAARVLSSLIERVMSARTGSLILLLAVAPFFMAPAFAGPMLHLYSRQLINIIYLLRFLPPFAAAAATGSSVVSASGWTLYLLAWCFVLAATLSLLERKSATSRTITEAHASWDSASERLAAYFGPDLAPLVCKTLRYYVRSPQTRLSYPFAVVLMVTAFLDPPRSFFLAIGIISMIGAASMGAMTLNVFGFDGSGFRRYFLLPVQPVKVLLATALVPLLLGIAIIPVSLAIWIAFAPIPIKAEMIVILISGGCGGLFLFQGLGIWTSLLSPRAIPFKATVGHRLPLAANLLMMSFIVVWMGIPFILEQLGTQTVLDRWWVAVLISAISLTFYVITVHVGAAVFVKRRETMLTAIERGY